MSQMERLYFFHQSVAQLRYPNSRTIMERFEVSEATARRDIAYLRDFLLAPLAFNRQRKGWYYTSNDFQLPFEHVPHIVWFLGLLVKMAGEAGLSQLRQVKKLEEKLTHLLSAHGAGHLVDAIHFEKIEAPVPKTDVLTTLFEALRHKRRVRFSYRKLTGEESLRTLSPLKLVHYQWRWYVVGFCHDRNDLRLFSTARMSSVELLYDPSVPLSDYADELERFLNAPFGIFKGVRTVTARVLFREEAAQLIKEQVWHKDQILEDTPEGVILSLPISDVREIAMKVLQYGTRAEVLEPEDLRQYVETQASHGGAVSRLRKNLRGRTSAFDRKRPRYL